MAQKTDLPPWLPALNLLTRGLTRLGLPMGPVAVLTVAGRRSGLPRTTPVTPIAVDGTRYLVGSLQDGDWVQNARAAGRGSLRTGRRVEEVLLPEVADDALKRAVMRAFPRQARGGVPFMVRLGLVTKADPDEFEAVADQVAIFSVERAP